MARLLNSLRECKLPVSHLRFYAFGHSMVAWVSSTLSTHFAYQAFSLGFWESQFFHRGLPSRRRCHLSNGVHPFCLPRLHFCVFSSYKCTRTFHDRLALKHWAPQLQGRKFIVACDNSAAVAVITSNALKDPFMQRCLRQMWFTAALFDFEVRVLHVPERHKQFADYLSR